MKTLTLDVKSLSDTLSELAQSWKSGQAEETARISFETPDLLWRVLTAKRWEILKSMTGQPAMSLREAARRVGRDVKAVHGDIHALLDAGILRRDEDGKISFPFDAVHVDFMLKAA